jgi:hypothetical protein
MPFRTRPVMLFRDPLVPRGGLRMLGRRMLGLSARLGANRAGRPAIGKGTSPPFEAALARIAFVGVRAASTRAASTSPGAFRGGKLGESRDQQATGKCGGENEAKPSAAQRRGSVIPRCLEPPSEALADNPHDLARFRLLPSPSICPVEIFSQIPLSAYSRNGAEPNLIFLSL